MAINQAQELVRQTGSLPVPLHLRNAPTKLMKDLDYGKDYKYSHDFPGNFVQQDFLPDQLKGQKLFEPQDNAAEQKLKRQLKEWWNDWYRY
jgi:putative ATPase